LTYFFDFIDEHDGSQVASLQGAWFVASDEREASAGVG
jgi:hypothetical protein